MTTPQPPQAAPASEREQFIAWMKTTNGSLRDFDVRWYESDGSFDNTWVNSAWSAWQARAALAAQQTAVLVES